MNWNSGVKPESDVPGALALENTAGMYYSSTIHV